MLAPTSTPVAIPLETSGGPTLKYRVAEFLVVGGITPFLFPLAWLLRKSLGLDDAQYAIGFTTFYAAHLINDPHFAVTYLLFYKDGRARALGDRFSRAQRLRYWLAGVIVPMLLAGWAIAALATKSASVLGLMIQLMFFLVGWHYVKQGFGVMIVLSARRGVRFDARERIVILAHCFAGWAYAWSSKGLVRRELEEKGVVYMNIARPHGLDRIARVALAFTVVALVGVLVQKWRREGRLPIATPLIALLSSIWAWLIFSSIDPIVVYTIPALHSIQYLYFVWLMKRNEGREREGPPHFEVSAKVRVGTLAVSAIVLGWVLFHGAPSALDDFLINRRTAQYTLLGATPYFAALYTFVNIHHFFMDYVIWRRENPQTRYLQTQ